MVPKIRYQSHKDDSVIKYDRLDPKSEETFLYNILKKVLCFDIFRQLYFIQKC